jgi:hypothetical protein
LRLIAVTLFFIVTYSQVSLSQEPVYKYVDYVNDSLRVRVDIVDSLPADLIKQINKGAPISFEFNLELWQKRSGWFDKLIEKQEISNRVRYDTWGKRFTVIRSAPGLVVEHSLRKLRETLELVSTTDSLSFVVSDTSEFYYVVCQMTISSMSLSNFKEVESWLKGELTDPKPPKIEEAPDKVGEFIFNAALKLSGLKNISKEIRTELFKLEQLPLSFEIKEDQPD